MSTVAYRRSSPLPLLLPGILLAAGIGLALIADQVSQHAIERHGEGAITVNECLKANGPDAQLRHTMRDWYAWVVCLPSGKYGVQMDVDETQELESNITAFKTRYEMLGDVLDYLTGGNWVVVWSTIMLALAVVLRAAWCFICNIGRC